MFEVAPSDDSSTSTSYGSGYLSGRYVCECSFSSFLTCSHTLLWRSMSSVVHSRQPVTIQLRHQSCTQFETDCCCCFWVFFCNSIVVATVGPPQNALQRARFFGSIGYTIGGQTYTLNAIEHGVRNSTFVVLCVCHKLYRFCGAIASRLERYARCCPQTTRAAALWFSSLMRAFTLRWFVVPRLVDICGNIVQERWE